MNSDNVKEQIQTAERKQQDITTAGDALRKRVTFLTLQADALKYPAAVGDRKAQSERAELVTELETLAGKLAANQNEADAVAGNLQALKAEYSAARLAEETAARDRAALELIACYQEIEKHRAAIQALDDRVPGLKAAADELNKRVVDMGGQRIEYAAPVGSDEIKSSFFSDMRASLQGALSGR